jgi:hypothetical protein
MEKDSLNHFSWVMKVLHSCQNNSQVETSEKLFELYLKMWKTNMSKNSYDKVISHFEKEKKSKLSFVNKKKKTSYFSKFSQFFLF